jgi:SAM-dependent methyltransferase
MFSWPRFPEFPDHFYDSRKVKASKFPNRYFYDWTVFAPDGLVEAERYWDQATAQLASLLPERFLRDSAGWSGINLGTFNGTFQKAWMRRGYSMYGIELADALDDLHAYGCEGHTDSIYDLSTIASGRFDFGVLDRVLCQEHVYDDRIRKKHELGHMPPLFKSIRRILKDGGAFIGVLYDWYDGDVVAELASMGGLTLWPHKAGRLAFCVDLAEPATALPMAEEAGPDSEYFVTQKFGSEHVKIFIPTNEMWRDENGRKTLTFAPPERDAAKKHRTKRGVIGDRLARGKNL